MANVRIENNILKVTEEKNYISVSEEQNVVNVIEHGTPIFVGNAGSQLFTYNAGGDYWYADEKISVNGFGEYYNSTYKPIFIFENNTQEMQLDGFINIKTDGINNPLSITSGSNSNIFKITTDEIAVFKMHSQLKTPISGGLYFYNGDLFVGV